MGMQEMVESLGMASQRTASPCSVRSFLLRPEPAPNNTQGVPSQEAWAGLWAAAEVWPA